MSKESPAEDSLNLIRGRLSDHTFIFRPLSASSDSNYSKSSRLWKSCFVGDLLEEYPTDSITLIRLNGLLHSDDNCASKDADQLLEKRVRSRFSHRKILFLPPSREEVDSLLEHLPSLPADSSFPSGYVSQFNEKIKNITSDPRFKDMLRTFLNANSTVNSLLKFIFRAVSSMNLESGILSLETFKAALSSMQRQPKLEAVRDCSILELYLLVCMRRLEVKEQSLYNFISVMKEYKTIHDSFQTSDHYAQNVCLRAFEHLREREVICYAENRGQSQTGEYRPMKLLILASELHQGMRSHACCPVSLHFCIYACFYFCKLISNLVLVISSLFYFVPLICKTSL
ncbi:PREDICTED: origin of replication complex subunit 4-like [Brassica oleracea var. oleracea]|uniref:origin of replication complex subunit 4-like n=1 Tax=Brassica oleracea var. oleracea TaxID=109376 RepID=UPI0006A6CF0E|nr:PREDICTED: origin of replication complex subunit 4-like [Brassica oleracea var. oleracea]